MTKDNTKRAYAAPVFEEAGLIARITMGNGGSYCDGGNSITQRFNGNDGQGPPGVCGPR